MDRLARVVARGIPHQITQGGNRRQPTFFCAEDHECDPELIAPFCRAEQVEIWAYRLIAGVGRSVAPTGPQLAPPADQLEESGLRLQQETGC
jgi:hypothetical protein